MRISRGSCMRFAHSLGERSGIHRCFLEALNVDGQVRLT